MLIIHKLKNDKRRLFLIYNENILRSPKGDTAFPRENVRDFPAHDVCCYPWKERQVTRSLFPSITLE